MNTTKDDRIINVFPQPYNRDTVVCKRANFSVKTKDACSSDKLGETVGMKVCKTIVIGDVAVGKTCLVNRYCRDVFETDYKATIGVDFQSENYTVLSQPFNMQIWDTAGQERFKCIASAYYRGANVIIVVFDLSDIKSLEAARRWLNEAMAENANHSPEVFVVGSKKDLCKPIDLKKMEEHAVQFAIEVEAEYWSVSSKTGENVSSLFTRSAALAFDQAILRELEEIDLIGHQSKPQFGNPVITLNNNRSKKEPISRRKGCC